MPIITTTKVMRPRDPNDFYPTPDELCTHVLDSFKVLPSEFVPHKVLDLGAGTGVWGRAVNKVFINDPIIVGVEIREEALKPLSYDYWLNMDCLALPPDKPLHGANLEEFDLIGFNPPYGIAEEILENAFTRLTPNGYMVMLLRLAFLESTKRGKIGGFYERHNPESVHVLAQRPSFTGDGKTDATAYAIYVWRKQSAPETKLHIMNWQYK